MTDSDTFIARVAQNKQITIKKDVRDKLGIVSGDSVVVHVIKVLSSEGHTKYRSDNSEKE